MKNCPLCQNPLKKIEKGNLTIYKCDQCNYANVTRRYDGKKTYDSETENGDEA